jgi:hypothetical protein
MPESKTISLLVPPESSSQQQSLQAQIQQIVSQKGHFRHVTEQSLRAEIQGKKSAHDPLITGSPPTLEQEEPDEDETPQKRQERLWKRRDEMLERLRYALSTLTPSLPPPLIILVTLKMRSYAHSTLSHCSYPSNLFQPKVPCHQL